MLAVAVTATTFAPTTATWFVEDPEDGEIVVSTLWSLRSGGWFPMMA